MPAGDVFGLDGFFLNKSNPVVVSTIGINSTAAGAGIAVTAGTFSAGTVTLNLSNAAGLTTTPFYTGAKIAVSGLSTAGVAYTGYNGTFNVTGFAGTTTVSYATTGYVGSVTASITGQTGRVILVSDTQVTNTTWSSAQTHGWFGGGFDVVPRLSTVDRIDFSNDTGTANIRGSLSLERCLLAATGNSNYGWFGAGDVPGTPAATSTVDRVDFSNDSSTASPRGPLSSARTSLTATGNSNYGWFGGGFVPGLPATVVSTVDRIDFSNDSGTASLRGPLSSARRLLATTGNSNYGWFGGGQPNPSISDGVLTVDRIDFSNDNATVSPRGSLSLGRFNLAAVGNSNYGWFGGGQTQPSFANRLSTVNRIDFSNDSVTASIRGPLSSARYVISATGNSNYGWFGGGQPGPGIVVDRIDFSNDSSTASVRGPLSSARESTSSATSGQARSSSIRLQKGGNFGWFGGGGVPAVATVDRINFSNDLATASPRSPLSAARYGLAATSNSNYGWFGGGQIPTAVATVDRIDFSNDLATASVRGPLSLERFNLAATGNSNYGWFAGGGPSLSPLATVDRIVFSNDSVSASPRGALSLAKQALAATGNSNYGWFGGGFPAVATVDRIDFSNDSIQASPRGVLSLARGFTAATGNSNYGWFGGGQTTPTTSASTVDRIDFSNDSVSASPRGPLLTRRARAATGNSNYGWFGGGTIPGPTIFATVECIDFSNDSATASVRGPLSASRYSLAATSNTPT
jgi:hypothetical protein